MEAAMGRVELRHYPASKLPDELRGEIALNSFVTVRIEETDKAPLPLNGTQLRDFLTSARSRLATLRPGEGAERIRRLRDEWDD
jgi:hypothetical protein